MNESGLSNLRVLSNSIGSYFHPDPKEKCKLSPINVNRLTEEVIQSHLMALNHKKLNISFLPGLFSFEAIVLMDEHKLRVVLDALLDHAIEHTQAGYVQIGYLPYAGSLDFFIRDSSNNKSEPVLRPVYVAANQKVCNEKPARQNYSLKIARSFVRLMGGSMKTLIRKGSGSLVTFSIPCLSSEESYSF
ncbi:MAG: HAMP domain-containing histidine kinase [Bacteroidales bacterium]|nr:HAMP domain-containing histidine kinase [Bacteroidales bacterium]